MDENTTNSPTPSTDNKTVMGVLAYLGPLVVVSYLIGREDPFVKFHVKQGLVLFVLEVAIWFFSGLLWGLFVLWQVVNFIILIFAILGILNVVKGKEKELPIVGQFAKYFPI